MKAYLVNNISLEVLELFEQIKQYDLNTTGSLGFEIRFNKIYDCLWYMWKTWIVEESREFLWEI